MTRFFRPRRYFNLSRLTTPGQEFTTTKGKWISFALKSRRRGRSCDPEGCRWGENQSIWKEVRIESQRIDVRSVGGWCALGRGENWMKHGSADAVCSFQATGLCNLFANPGYCGTTDSLRRSGAARRSALPFVKRYFVGAGGGGNNEVPEPDKKLAFLSRIMSLVNNYPDRGLSPEAGWKRKMRLIRVQ